MKLFRRYAKIILPYLIMFVVLRLFWNCYRLKITTTTASAKAEKIIVIQYVNCTSQENLQQARDEKGKNKVENPQVSNSSSKPEENIIQYDSVFNRGLLVEWWFDLCFARTTWERTWHPLFPAIPQKTTTTFIAGDKERTVGNYLRRIHGYLYTNQSNHYEFKLLSRDGAEVILLDTGVSLENDEKLSLSTLQNAKEILYLNLVKEQMDKQDPKIPLSEMFSSQISKVWLKSGRLYYVEIVQGGKHFVKVQLQWRNTGGSSNDEFTVPTHDNLLHTRKPLSYSGIHQKTRHVSKFPILKEERLRNAFHKIPVLNTTGVLYSSSTSATKNKYVCDKTMRKQIEIKTLYEGYWKHVESFVSYPKEYFNFIGYAKQSQLLLDKDVASNVAHKTFERLDELYNGRLKLQDIVHVQMNNNNANKGHGDWRKTLYFVEFDVKMKTNDSADDVKVFRASHHVRLSKETGVCFIPEYQWQSDVEIHLITPISNQKVWLLYLIQVLQEVQEKTNEKNVQLILVDFNSTDGDYASILKSSGLRHKYLSIGETKFNKVKALNYGLKHLTDDNSIAFILDLQLELPLNIFDRIRKFTLQGRTAFAPTLLKLACGEHEQYTKLKGSEWLDIGVGMIGMYKSDWTSVKGYNEARYNNKWGGEDWELLDRVVGQGLYVIHYRLPRFYHVHHARKGAWYGKKT